MLPNPLDRAGLDRLAAQLRIDAGRSADSDFYFTPILVWAADDKERLLDLLHYTLILPSRTTSDWQILDILLELGGSVWRATENGLERRVDPSATQAFNAATATPDSASEEPADAWSPRVRPEC
jgi:hypothetical protein